MDTIGYGDSYKPNKDCTIEDYAQGAIELLDALGISKTSLVGHHTGAVIAIELASTIKTESKEWYFLMHCTSTPRSGNP